MILLYLIGLYLIAGALFSVPFLSKWIYDVDEAAHGTNWTFKLAIFPGCVVLWPSLLKKYIDTKNNKL
ncbi:MAG: hypothetical protein HYR67_01550 [Bacteroidetes bacterium]|nr:hypothetical protein [Bacteroidota bacterium]